MASHPDSVAARPAIVSSRDWYWGILPVGIVLAAVAIMPATFAFLARNSWSTLGYSHGPLVALISLVLVWREGRAARPVSRSGVVPLLLLAAALALWLGARFAFVDVLQQVLAVAIAWVALWAAYGARRAIAFAFPVAFALLAIPVWDVLIEPLQRITTAANEIALAAVGVPAHITGNVVAVPAGTFEIAGGCSGLHFFVVALAVGSLHAYLQRYTLRWSIATLALALGLALVTNWIRVLVIIWRGNATAMRTSLITDHYWFGWYLFAGAIALFFVVVARFPIRAAASEPTSDSAAPQREGWLGAAVPVSLMVACGLYAQMTWDRWASASPIVDLPAASPGWVGREVANDSEWSPGFLGPKVRRSAVYDPAAGGGTVHVTRLAYTVQGSDGKLVGYGSGIAPTGWRTLEDRAVDGAWRIAELRSPSGERWAVLYGYRVGSLRTSSTARVRLLQGLNGFGVPRDSGADAIASRCTDTCATAAAAARTFLNAHPALAGGEGSGRRS